MTVSVTTPAHSLVPQKPQLWKTLARSQTCAKKLAQGMQTLPCKTDLAYCIVALQGPLGAGKSTFARHLLQALGVTGRIKSPSYAIVESYVLPGLADMQAWHCDFYRFQSPAEWEDSGLRDIFAGPGIKLVEWPELAQSLLPTPDLELTLEFASPGRTACWQANSALGGCLLGQVL